VRDKEIFVRHLANEGFIPNRFRWFSDDGSGWALGVEWRIEDFSGETDLEGSGASRSARAFMIRLLVYASLLWLMELTFLFFRSR
jgi:hypothetical protein